MLTRLSYACRLVRSDADAAVHFSLRCLGLSFAGFVPLYASFFPFWGEQALLLLVPAGLFSALSLLFCYRQQATPFVVSPVPVFSTAGLPCRYHAALRDIHQLYSECISSSYPFTTEQLFRLTSLMEEIPRICTSYQAASVHSALSADAHLDASLSSALQALQFQKKQIALYHSRALEKRQLRMAGHFHKLKGR